MIWAHPNAAFTPCTTQVTENADNRQLSVGLGLAARRTDVVSRPSANERLEGFKNVG